MRVCLSCSAIGCCTCMKRHLRGPSSVEIVCAQRRELSLSVHPVPLTPPPDVSMSRFLPCLLATHVIVSKVLWLSS